MLLSTQSISGSPIVALPLALEKANLTVDDIALF
jgi:hypothetical protein